MREFQIDKKRVKACIEYKDYYSAMEYSILVKDLYKNKDKELFEELIKLIKNGNYEKIKKYLQNFLFSIK